MPTSPPVPPDGRQDGDPPDVRLAVHATLVLLDDLKPHLATRPSEADLLLRVVALRSALGRVRDDLEARP